MDSSDNDDTTDFPMLDRLAFDCTRLAADLTTVAADRAAGDRLLATYIARADQLDAPIDDFDDDLDWFNVTEPLSLSADAAASAANNDADDDDARHSSPANTSAGTSASLRGKIVILDFFTYCCINCLHVLPDLRRIERLHTVPAGLCVVGVHSAKFANERDSANILAAVQRHHIGHPVVNDATGAMWQRLAVHCWPTLLVLGPRANPLFVLMGEGNYEALERYVGAALAFYGGTAQSGGGAAAALSAHSLPLDPAIDLIVSGGLVLRFPAKIASTASAPQPDGIDADDAAAELFAIVDTGHNRVLVADASGRILHRIGGRKAGFVDGDFRAVRFNGPQGACFRYEPAADGRPAQQPRWLLYVADTENHALRCCDLRRQTVETVAGTGVQGNDRLGGRCGREQALASPWDVAVCRMRQQDMSFHEEGRAVPEVDVVLIACAGTHQIWALFVEETIWWRFRRYAAGAVVAIVGNGNEENRNNSYPANAAFAQPSGLAWRADAKEVFVADSESSSVRRVQLADGKVTAVAGGDRNPLNLFAYGDADGKGYAAKLQHPLGVAYAPLEQACYVADTYNHRIKRIDCTTGQCVGQTFSGAAENNINSSSGSSPGSNGSEEALALQEPGGLCCSRDGRHLYVADTNNHRIVRVELSTGRGAAWPLRFDGVAAAAETVTDGAGRGAPKAAAVRSERTIRITRTSPSTAASSSEASMTSLRLSLEFPSDATDDDDDNDESASHQKLTPDAPQRVVATVNPSQAGVVVRTFADNFCAAQPTVLLALGHSEAASTSAGDDEPALLALTFRLNVCTAKVCRTREFQLEIPIVVTENERLDDSNAGDDDVLEWRLLVRPDAVAFAYDSDDSD